MRIVAIWVLCAFLTFFWRFVTFWKTSFQCHILNLASAEQSSSTYLTTYIFTSAETQAPDIIWSSEITSSVSKVHPMQRTISSLQAFLT